LIRWIDAASEIAEQTVADTIEPVLRLRRALRPVVVLAAVSTAAAAQTTDPKPQFLDALGRFSLALQGSYGDEGGRIRPALESLDRARREWDSVVGRYETAMKADVAGAAPAAAARMHLALGAVYLDRGRRADAQRELAAAAMLDPSRADALIVQGIVNEQLNQGPAAIAALRKASALDPTNPTLTYSLGRAILRAGTPSDAIPLFQRFRDAPLPSTANPAAFLTSELIAETPGLEPFFPPVLYADGFTKLQNGDFVGAIVAFQAAAARDSLTGTGIESGAIAQGAAAFRSGDLSEAAKRFTTAIELAPDRAEPHRLFGLVQLAARRYDEAIDAMRAAIRIDPRDERPRIDLADALVASGRLDEAAQHLTDTLTVFQASGRARYLLGLVYQRQGRYPQARQELAKAASLKPLLGMNSILQDVGALARSQQEYDAAIEAFSSRVDLVPNDPQAHLDLGEMYVRQGRHEEALAEFTASLLLDRTRPDVFTSIGQVHLREGRFEKASEAARRALALDAMSKEAHYLLATSLLRLGRETEGRQELEIYQRLQTEATAARARQLEIEGFRRDAAISAASKDYGKAAALLRQALERDPKSAATHRDLGLTLLNAGRAAEAIDELRAALSSAADDADLHAYLAQAYDALGRRDESARERATADRMMREQLRRAGAER
jgi:tetratricopeptide (TPR) repeat protein